MPLRSRKASFHIANLTRKPMSLLRVGTLSGLDSSVSVLAFIRRLSVLFIPLENKPY